MGNKSAKHYWYTMAIFSIVIIGIQWFTCYIISWFLSWVCQTIILHIKYHLTGELVFENVQPICAYTDGPKAKSGWIWQVDKLYTANAKYGLSFVRFKSDKGFPFYVYYIVINIKLYRPISWLYKKFCRLITCRISHDEYDSLLSHISDISCSHHQRCRRALRLYMWVIISHTWGNSVTKEKQICNIWQKGLWENLLLKSMGDLTAGVGVGWYFSVEWYEMQIYISLKQFSILGANNYFCSGPCLWKTVSRQFSRWMFDFKWSIFKCIVVITFMTIVD